MNILGVKPKCYTMTKNVFTCNPLNRLKDFTSATASCDRNCYFKYFHFYLDIQSGKRGRNLNKVVEACGPVTMSCVMCLVNKF